MKKELLMHSYQKTIVNLPYPPGSSHRCPLPVALVAPAARVSSGWRKGAATSLQSQSETDPSTKPASFTFPMSSPDLPVSSGGLVQRGPGFFSFLTHSSEVLACLMLKNVLLTENNESGVFFYVGRPRLPNWTLDFGLDQCESRF